MAEAGKENVFLREKCEKCFVEIIDAMISTRKVKQVVHSMDSIPRPKSSTPGQSRPHTGQSLSTDLLDTIYTKIV